MEPNHMAATVAPQETVAKIEQKALRLSALLREVDNHPVELAGQVRRQLDDVLELLAPLAPHQTEELWERIGHSSSIHHSRWPGWDESLAAAQQVTVAVQVNGKPRGTFEVPAGTPKDELERRARELPRIRELLEGQTIRKVVAVPDRIVNFVVG